MIKTRYYSLSVNGMKKMQYLIINIGKLAISDELKKHILEECQDELKKLCSQTLIPADEAESGNLQSNYLSSFGSEIKGDYIYIYNNATIDMSEVLARNPNMDISNYPPRLSLAKIVEYGVGYTGGLRTDKSGVKDWEYDVNNHGYKGWYYHDSAGNVHWTNGYEGRLIFYRLKKIAKEKAPKWVEEFFEKNIKD